MERLILFLAVSLLFVSNAFAEVKTQELTYKADDTALKGFLAYDDSIKEKRPGVIVVHEWWGHNEYARTRAKMLAELGYVALAVDMYGDGKTADHPDDAKKFMNEALANGELFKKKFEAGLALLNSQPQTDPEKTAAIGYCFGGATVLAMARAGVDLDGVVSFHGILATETPAQKGAVKAKVLAFHGADDPFVPKEQADAFRKEMNNAEVDYTFVVFPGIQHSFTNPGATEVGKKFELPLVYDKEADESSWKQTQEFLEKIFSK
ncbi:MAG: dienelactone hydrolase family protein [Candidatus Dadabacteria bacterium]|nr:dienelactone hydrolase family protein [Candidatus Dadabacteria bacterium]NIS08435.1 dienelactone hydrolase family protein [Candidatus Dadabacteria bacterium]NIV42000.1 dienelactone hydrolase family protein [Candidatus Dadabacteria bacterium]NIY21923.1 dienelactone hydrolase family protein [Candidatus Dadabacteria bacterium]